MASIIIVIDHRPSSQSFDLIRGMVTLKETAMIIQVTKNDRISFDILHLEGLVIAPVVQDNLEDLDALERSLSAIETQFPNLNVNYLLRPKDIGAGDPNFEPEEIAAGSVWIQVNPPGHILKGRRLEPLEGENGERARGWRNRHVIGKSLKKCFLEFAEG